MRFAEALNLSSEPDSALPTWLQEEYRWTFWSVYLLDRLVSCSPQYKPAVQDANCNLHLPRQPIGLQDGDDPRAKITLASLYNRNNRFSDIDQAGFLIFVTSALGRVQKYSLRSSRSPQPYPPWDFRSEFASINTALVAFESCSPLIWAKFENVLDEQALKVAKDGTLTEIMGILCFTMVSFHLPVHT